MGASSIRRFLVLYRQEYRRARANRRGDPPAPAYKRIGWDCLPWVLGLWMGLAKGGLENQDAFAFGLLAGLLYGLAAAAFVAFRKYKLREGEDGSPHSV